MEHAGAYRVFETLIKQDGRMIATVSSNLFASTHTEKPGEAAAKSHLCFIEQTGFLPPAHTRSSKCTELLPNS
jgi:hypothetical protein